MLRGEKSKFISFIKEAKTILVKKLKQELEKTITNSEDLPDEDFVIEQDVGKVVNQTSTIEAGGNSFVITPETNSFNDITNPNNT